MTTTIQFDRSFGIDIPDGGTVWVDPDETTLPDTFGCTPTGAILGPLEVGVPNGGDVALESVTFEPGEDSGGWFLSAGVAGAATVSLAGHPDTDVPGEQIELGRRGVLTLLAAIAGAALAADTTAADENGLVTLQIATFDLADADEPWSVRVLDIVDEVLPDTTEVLVDQSETRVGEITDPGDPVVLQPDAGEVRVYIRDSIGRIDQLLAWARSILPSDSSLTFSRTFPNGHDASDFEESEFITLTEHPAIVEPVIDSGPDRTVFEIDGEEIPHVDDGANELGAWDIVGDGLIFDVGTNPPAADEWTITTQLSFTQAIRH